MNPRFAFGQRVRVVRTVRNDGTYPGLDRGARLVGAGATGVVRDVGVFLQDQLIYTVHFTGEDRYVGCRQQELMDADEDWVPTRFEFRQSVRNRIPLAIDGRIVVATGQRGQVTRVLRQAEPGPAYQVLFEGRIFQVPESALDDLPPVDDSTPLVSDAANRTWPSDL
jgi:nitrogen fixation protein NifZ